MIWDHFGNMLPKILVSRPDIYSSPSIHINASPDKIIEPLRILCRLVRGPLIGPKVLVAWLVVLCAPWYSRDGPHSGNHVRLS